MKKGLRVLLVSWVVLLSVATAGSDSYNDHLDSLPSELPRYPPHHFHTLPRRHACTHSCMPPCLPKDCVSGKMCNQEIPGHCRHGAASLKGQLSHLRQYWMVIFRSLEFPCDGAILNVSVAVNTPRQEQRGIELQIWRFYPNDSLMLVRWAEPRKIECVDCMKNPMYLSEPLLFRKGDVLGIYRTTATTDLSYVHAVSQNLSVASTDAIVLSVSDAEGIHQLQGSAVTRTLLSQYSDRFGRKALKLSQVSPLIELELSCESPHCVCTAEGMQHVVGSVNKLFDCNNAVPFPNTMFVVLLCFCLYLIFLFIPTCSCN